MASVSALDKDLRNLRLAKYSPEAANEVRDWMEEALGEKLAAGDLMDALKDGVVLCKLVALAVPPGPKYKVSSMPFVQMENISHFLKACQAPPLGMHPHDVFLTVDLFERKDPAQVIQCIVAFSRRANVVQPDRFPRTIGPKSRGPSVSGTGSPQRWGSQSTETGVGRERVASNASQGSASTFNASSRFGPSEADTPGSSPSAKSNGGSATKVKGSWNKTTDGGAAAPAWNIHQYGYMGGASQGNQGISFGGRRQITTPSPRIPGRAEKEKQRQEELAEQERRQREMDEAEERAQAEREAEEERERAAEEKRERAAEEERERAAEEQRWEEETQKQRERERVAVEEEKQRRDAAERQRKDDEDRRRREAQEQEARHAAERRHKKTGSDVRLQGQFLSDYQAEERSRSMATGADDRSRGASEQDRVRQLEMELERARDKEKRYEREHHEQTRPDQITRRSHIEEQDYNARTRQDDSRSPTRDGHRPSATSHKLSENSWQAKERDYLRREWGNHHPEPFGTTPSAVPHSHESYEVSPPHSPVHGSNHRHHAPPSPTRHQPRDSLDSDYPDDDYTTTPVAPGRDHASSRPLPEPSPVQVKTNTTGPSSRPLPDPSSYAPHPNRTDQFLASNPAPVVEKPKTHLPSEFSFDSAAERDFEDARRHESQAKTQAGGWASKSLLEREMEKERQRQQEWEEGQKATHAAAQRRVGLGQAETTAGAGGSWDVNQYGWTGGDSQNRGGAGLGGRRQIIGPRPPP